MRVARRRLGHRPARLRTNPQPSWSTVVRRSKIEKEKKIFFLFLFVVGILLSPSLVWQSERGGKALLGRDCSMFDGRVMVLFFIFFLCYFFVPSYLRNGKFLGIVISLNCGPPLFNLQGDLDGGWTRCVREQRTSTGGFMGQWTDGRTDGRMDGWMVRWRSFKGVHLGLYLLIV